MKAIVGVSGGPDSAVTLGIAIEMGVEPIPVFIDVNPYNVTKAWPAAVGIAERYGLGLEVVMAPEWVRQSYREFPSGFFGLPFTTLYIVTTLCQLAYVRDSRLVICGFREGVGADDRWLVTLQNLVLTAGPATDHENPVMLSLPLYGKGHGYGYTIQEAQRLGIDLSRTWSCNRYPCPGCGKCRERQRSGIDALAAAAV